MTDAATGSVASPPAGNPPPQTPQAPNGSSASGGGSWLDGLSEGNRQLATNKGWTTPESLDKAFTSYSELEQRIGQSVALPKPDASPDEWNKFYSRVGRPESADKYEFKRPENLPADLPYDDNLAKASKAWMFEAGATPGQAQVMHDKFMGYVAEQQQAARERVKAAVEASHDQLVKDWGGPTDSAPFKEKLALADRAMKKLGLTEAYKKSGLLLEDGSVTDPQIAKAFAEIGAAMFKEDTLDDKGGGDAGANPFKLGAEGQKGNITAMVEAYRKDPSRAKAQALSAGWKEAEFDRWFQPSNPR